MKLLIVTFTAILVFKLFLSPVNVSATNGESSGSAEVVDVYAEFWPVVPGTTVADSMFWAKQLKETLGGLFKMGNINKSENEIGISEKRFVEASKLFELKDYPNAFKSLDLNKTARENALDYKKKAVNEKSNVIDLTQKLVKSLEKQKKVLMFIEDTVPEDQKARLSEIINNLTLQISEAK